MFQVILVMIVFSVMIIVSVILKVLNNRADRKLLKLTNELLNSRRFPARPFYHTYRGKTYYYDENLNPIKTSGNKSELENIKQVLNTELGPGTIKNTYESRN